MTTAHPPRSARSHREGGWTLEAALERLGRRDRTKSEDPRALWSQVGLPRGATVVDVGCGLGFYAIPAARRVGPTGRVWALDISGELVDWLNRRAQTLHLGQLTARRSTPRHLPLPTGSADYLLVANLLHGILGPDSPMLREIARLLRPGGQFINVDWIRRRTENGPPFSIRLSPTAARRAVGPFGFVHRETWAHGPTHYAQRFERVAPRRPQTD
ncbi:MAG: class I SAM-dependent methyltransferase [Thermoplasmata archaeon]